MEKIQITTSEKDWKSYEKFRKRKHISQNTDLKIIFMALFLLFLFLAVRIGYISDVMNNDEISAYFSTSDRGIVTASSWIFVILGLISCFCALITFKIFKFKKDRIVRR